MRLFCSVADAWKLIFFWIKGCLKILFIDSFCILVKSSDNYPCDSQWRGGRIFINLNQQRKAIIPSGFRRFQFCIPSNQIDISKDQFQLRSSNNNDVCIEQLFVNSHQIFVGALNDQPSFIINGNRNSCSKQQMITSQITIQNSRISSSECKGS